MKKQLFFGSLMITAFGALAQNGRINSRIGSCDMAARLAVKYEILNSALDYNPASTDQSAPNISTAPALKRSSSSSAFTWNPISSSMNVYGVLVANSKCLQFNEALNAVSFIHRMSASYQPNPFPSPMGAQTGVIVGLVSTDLGVNWDSTCIWNDNTNWARYPHGGIWNSSATNTNLSSAYIVATGPITPAAGGWIGNFFASKSLASFNNAVSSTPNATLFIANSGSMGATGKVDFARYDFTSTKDGVVRTLGSIYNDANGTTAATQGWRGISIVKGIFTSGVFVWSADSILLNDANISGVTTLPITLGGRFVNQAWNDAGTIGYVWYYGSRAGTTGSNIGIQPIVYKTTNSGLTWVVQPYINFNDAAKFKTKVLDHLFPAFNTTTTVVPFFNYSEGFDGTVDNNGELHIMTTLVSSNRAHQDSLFATYSFNNPDGEVYSYAHGATDLLPYDATVRLNRPYIYDFYTNSAASPTAAWNVAVIDSMPTEAPGETSSIDGYGDNPWDATGSGGAKVGCDARLQMSRTPGGSKILYTWAESDTVNATKFGHKWNSVPNLHVRMMDMNPPYNYGVRPEEFNLTAGVTYVKDKAVMHNTSPRCAFIANTNTANPSYSLALPIKVTNNQNSPMTQLLPNTHWYTTAILDFTVAVTTPTDVGVSEISKSVMGSVLYPNPTIKSANLQIALSDNSKVEINVLNLMGQIVKSVVVDAQGGRNEIPVNVEGLKTGIYMVNVKVGNATSTKKLILE